MICVNSNVKNNPEFEVSVDRNVIVNRSNDAMLTKVTHSVTGKTLEVVVLSDDGFEGKKIFMAMRGVINFFNARKSEVFRVIKKLRLEKKVGFTDGNFIIYPDNYIQRFLTDEVSTEVLNELNTVDPLFEVKVAEVNNACREFIGGDLLSLNNVAQRSGIGKAIREVADQLNYRVEYDYEVPIRNIGETVIQAMLLSGAVPVMCVVVDCDESLASKLEQILRISVIRVSGSVDPSEVGSLIKLRDSRIYSQEEKEGDND